MASEDNVQMPGGSGTSVNTSNRVRNNTRRNNNHVTLSNPVNYDGECDKVGGILALRVEKFNKKLPYEQFIEKIVNYITKKYVDGADIKPLLTDGKDPVRAYENKNKPKPLPDEDKDDPVMDAILKEEVKQFVMRKNNIRRNIQSAYSLVWGQCSSALQAYIKGLDGYTNATDNYDLKWLLDELKKASSGIDSNANKYATMHKSLMILYRMRQGATEPDDSYVERFKNVVATIEMVNGGHLFYSDEIAGKMKHLASEQEIHAAKEASKAMIMLYNSDQGRYGNLISDLEKGADLGRD